ncbi:hypothetical protein LINPERPRIM_LOCUS15544 [Linum perenne]
MRRSELKATEEGVVRLPWSLAMISTLPLTATATQELVVPRSIPITTSAPLPPSPFVSSFFTVFPIPILLIAGFTSSSSSIISAFTFTIVEICSLWTDCSTL